MPLLATMRATSPLEIMPTPIWTHSRLVYRHSLAPRPQPMILETMAHSSRSTEKRTMERDMSGKTTLAPMLAKKQGERSMSDNPSHLEAM